MSLIVNSLDDLLCGISKISSLKRNLFFEQYRRNFCLLFGKASYLIEFNQNEFPYSEDNYYRQSFCVPCSAIVSEHLN